MPVIGDIQLGQITRRTIMKYREHLVGLNNAENTKFHKFSNLSAMFTWAIERGYIEHNPCRLVDWPRRGATDNSHLEDWGSENMMKLMLWIDANHPRDRAFFEVMTQGVERGAVAGMRIRDFKIEESVVVLEQNILDIVGGQPKWGIVKGRKREVPVDTEQYKIISNHIVAQGRFLLNEYGIKQTKESPLFNRYYLARQETDLIKSGEEIQWLDPDWITVTSKRNTAGAGLHPVKPHEWRKVLRTIHRELGISIDDSAELLGNTVLTVAKYYTPKSSETLKRNAQKVLELKQKRLKDMNVEQITKHASNDG
jgi:integrase